MRIQNNITAMNTHRMYTANNNSISKSAEKLSSGYRINRAGDDAAGLAISEKMRSQIRGLNMASKNSQDANSLIQTAEGALQEVHSMLQRMNELANQSATGTNEDFDRTQISAEFDQLKNEINDISEQTNFNNMKLLDGSLASGASKVEVDAASTLKNGATFTGTNTSYTVTNHTGLSAQSGTYAITDLGSGKINVEFTDIKTGNVTNTEIDLNKVTSNPINKDDTSPVANGKSFAMDLSAAGLGTYTVTGSETVASSVSASNLAAALAANANSVTTATDVTATSTWGTPTPIAQSANTGAATYTFTATEQGFIDDRLEALSLDPGKYDVSLRAGAAGVMDLIATNKDDATQVSVIGTGTIDVPGGGAAGSLTIKDSTAAANELFKVTFGDTSGTAGGNTVANISDALKDMKIGTTEIKSNNPTEGKGGLKIQVGANEGEQLTISVEKMNVEGLGLTNSKISDQTSAGNAITATQDAINLVSEQRSTLGAMQNRLEHKISNLDNTSENLSASESRIRDVDIAKEMTAFTKNQILSQAATAMLAQANSMPQNVLSLLQ